MVSAGWEETVRAAAFEAIAEAQRIHGEVLAYDVIRRPVVVDGEEIAIFSLQRGIHKPRQLDAALAVTTTPPKRHRDAPYDDRFEDGIFRYHYRDPSTDSQHARDLAAGDNEAVRRAMREGLPLIYWHGIVPSHYLPIVPVYVIEDHPEAREFSLDLAGLGGIDLDGGLAAEEPSRAYRTTLVTTRIHQARFREAVLRAYRRCCAVCRLKRSELIDAAHIVGDAEGGEPVVANGLALCKLHHAAFDRHILGIRPDLRIIIRHDILEEVDGPMLVHGLQGFHDTDLANLPRRRRDRPADDFLERRWERFLEAG